MKKLLPLILLSVVLLGCSKEETSQNKLLGTWEIVQETNENFEGVEKGTYLNVRQITFLFDNSYESISYLENEKNSEKLGFLSKSIGSYTIDDDDYISYLDNYWDSNKEGDPKVVPLDDLVLVNTNRGFLQTYDFEKNKLILGCCPLQNCAPMVFTRVD